MIKESDIQLKSLCYRKGKVRRELKRVFICFQQFVLEPSCNSVRHGRSTTSDLGIRDTSRATGYRLTYKVLNAVFFAINTKPERNYIPVSTYIFRPGRFCAVYVSI